MLVKHVIGYAPSLLIPAITSFAAIYCYTRLMTPDEYGYYALTLSMMTLFCAVFFYWLQVSLPRLMPQAVKESKALQLRSTAFIAFAGTSLILVICAALFALFMPHRSLYQVAWLAVPLALVRSALTLNQAFHRSALDFKRYNLIECGQAVLGLMTGLTLVYFLHMGNRGALLGLIFAMACMMLVDCRQWLNISDRYFSRTLLTEIIHFGLPLTFTYGLAFIIASSDRFLIDYFRGSAEVGIYAAGYTLMDRITSIIFMAVSLPSFPLLANKLEQEGAEEAGLQTRHNGIMALMLALPLLAGLILARQPLAAFVIGSSFREGAIQVMPWIAVAAFCNGLATHYFDHAFYLAKKPLLLLLTQGPAAILNLILNIILIPQYGYMGAVYSCVSSYALLLLLSICVGRYAFPVQFPFIQALRIAGAVLLMAAVVSQITFSVGLAGLIQMSVTGIVVYAGGLLLFDVMDLRSRLLNRAR